MTRRGAALIAALASAVLLSGCGDTAATMARLLEHRGRLFAELTKAQEIYCKPAQEDYRGHQVFDCHWLTLGKPRKAAWEILAGETIGRLSEGGGDATPPKSAKQATRVVDSAQFERLTDKMSADCLPIVKVISRHVVSHPKNAYSCYILSPYTGLAVPWSEGPNKGEPARMRWRWNAGGTVAEEALDFTLPSEETVLGTPPKLERETPALEQLEASEGKFGISEEKAESEPGSVIQ